MYLSELIIENFRIFGSLADKKHLQLEFDPGLNVLVGENDSGKTAVIDAVRLLVGTRSNEWYGLTPEDFHIKKDGEREKSLRISAIFRDFADNEAAALLEWLNLDTNASGKCEWVLRVTLDAERREVGERRSRRERDVLVTFRAGTDTDGKSLEGEARDLLRVTYLKPLRDAEQELAAKRGSRLAQVLDAHPRMKTQREPGWNEEKPDEKPTTLHGIMKQAEFRLGQNDVVQDISKELNDRYLKKLSLGDEKEKARGRIGTGSHDFRQILERLRLTLEPPNNSGDPISRGLGINNLLFMSTELLLLGGGNDPSMSLVLIEEPEAHLHPQLQARLIQFLLEFCRPPSKPDVPPAERHRIEPFIQAILTSHSPHLASMVPLKHLIVMSQGCAFPMRPSCTKLDKSDYEYLERFLDVTKANLFFARGVLIVEGEAEQILLPMLAELIGRSLYEHGVSIVKVGTVGLFRYSRIFQGTARPDLPVRVACVTDRDIPADSAKPYIGTTPSGKPRQTASDYRAEEITQRIMDGKSHDGGPVKTFVSNNWTLEYDLALHGLAKEVHAAVKLSEHSQGNKQPPDDNKWNEIVQAANADIYQWQEEGKKSEDIAALVYRSLYEKRASKPETAQYLGRLLLQKKPEELRRKLPPYLVEAIDFAAKTAKGLYFTGACTSKFCAECENICKAGQ